MLKKLNGVNAQLGIFFFVVSIVLFLYFRYEGKNDTIDVLKNTVVTQRVENVTAKKVITDQTQSAAISEEVVAKAHAESTALQQKGNSIAKRTDEKVALIEKTYEALPATPANVQAKETEKYTTIASSMWETYCAAAPESEQCIGKTF